MTDSVQLTPPVTASRAGPAVAKPVRLLGWLAGIGIGSAILIMIGASMVRQDWMYPPVPVPAVGPPFELHVHVSNLIVVLALWAAALLATGGIVAGLVAAGIYPNPLPHANPDGTLIGTATIVKGPDTATYSWQLAPQ